MVVLDGLPAVSWAWDVVRRPYGGDDPKKKRRRCQDDVTGFRHDALLYRSEEELLDGLLPFLEGGVDHERPTVAVVGRDKEPTLRKGLGSRAASVHFIPSEDWYRRPVRTVAAYRRLVNEMQLPDRGPAHVVGEVHFGETELERREWIRYESVLNWAFEDLDVHIVCPYDVRTLPREVVDASARTHRRLLGENGRGQGDGYVDPEEFLSSERSVPPPDGRSSTATVTGIQALPGLRHRLTEAAEQMGVEGDLRDDFLLAVNEIVTNAILHGGGAAEVAIGRSDGLLVCEIADRGRGIDSPLTGYLPPSPNELGGRGIWVARQLVDGVDLIGSEQGTIVRLAVRLS